MEYAVNEEGILALRALSGRLNEGVSAVSGAADALENALDSNRLGLGPHAGSISLLISEVRQESRGACGPVSELSAKVLDLANEYQEFVDTNRFGGAGSAAGAGVGAGAASAGSGAGEQAGDPMAGVKRIAGEHSAASDIIATNPNHDKTGQTIPYNYNCQRCVPAYEARCRGYDVQARPIPQPDPHRLGEGHNWVSMFKDPVIIPCSGNGKEDIVAHMKEWGEGARAEVRCDWIESAGGGGHVFVAEVINGEVHFMDPQTGDTDCSWYFDDIEPGSVELVRTDNLQFTDKILECIQ